MKIKKKYEIIKNVLPKDLCSFFTDYYFLRQQVAAKFKLDGYISNDKEFFGYWIDSQIFNTYSCYGDFISDLLLLKLKPLFEKYTGSELFPTYSYMRIYKRGDELKIHRDRPSCEVSGTLNLGGNKWPIFFKEENKKEIKINLSHGDLAIYKGCELYHWREPFDNEYCVQIFFHYSTNKELIYDTRDFIGLPAEYKKDSPKDFLKNILELDYLRHSNLIKK